MDVFVYQILTRAPINLDCSLCHKMVCTITSLVTHVLQDLIDGFHCDCQPGFFGDQCDFEHDECASSPCVNGVCHVSIYTCIPVHCNHFI